jgi:hypothetical protein
MDMRNVILRLGVLAAAFTGLSAFDNPPNLPPEYSPNYSYIDVVTPNGKVKRVLVPDACMTAPEEPSPAGLGEERMLPSGCANAYNLQRMVARKKDLVEGRRISRAPMAPAARAATKYLDGPEPAYKKDQAVPSAHTMTPSAPQN